MLGARLATGPCWAIDAPEDGAAFLLALPELMPPGSILVLEECAMAREIRSAIAPFLVEPSLRLARQTILPRSRQHHLVLTSQIAQVLAAQAEAYGPAAPQLCDHLSVYHGSTVLLEWHDAFLDNPALLSHELPESSVRGFAQRLGTAIESFAV